MFRSFKTKTALLPVLLSSLMLVTTGVLAWKWLQQKLHISWEEKITLPGQRMAALRDLSSDWSTFDETLNFALSQDWQDDRVVQVRSNFGEREILYTSDNWPEGLITQDIPNFENAKPRMTRIGQENLPRHYRRPLLEPPYLYWTNTQSSRWQMATFTNQEITLYFGINHNEHIAYIRQSNQFAKRAKLEYVHGLLLLFARCIPVVVQATPSLSKLRGNYRVGK